MAWFYKRLVGITKSAFRKSVGKLRLTPNQLNWSRRVGNSKPLAYIDKELKSFSALTLIHFLSLIPRQCLTILQDNENQDDPDFSLKDSSSAEMLL